MRYQLPLLTARAAVVGERDAVCHGTFGTYAGIPATRRSWDRGVVGQYVRAREEGGWACAGMTHMWTTNVMIALLRASETEQRPRDRDVP